MAIAGWCLECLQWYHVRCAQKGSDPYFVCHITCTLRQI
jgi:hypothetical protein